MKQKNVCDGTNRRSFLASSALAVAALSGMKTSPPAAARTRLTAGELNAYLNSLGKEWIDQERTVDTFKSGGPDTVIEGIAVAWMSYTGALRKALDLGCNVFVTHEPTYYNHRDNDEKIFRLAGAREKKEFIERSGITIIRCHDVWDQYPEIGIPTAWGKFLELGEPVCGSGYFYLYDGKGETSAEIARRISRRTAALGQPAVQLVGPETKKINKIILGTGAITPFFKFLEDFDADLFICTDDGITYWRDAAYAIDNNIPMVVVNHAVSEDYGMELLAGHLKEKFPGVPVHHIQQGCMYRQIRG